MRWAVGVFLVVMFMISVIPPVSGQYLTFTTPNSIEVVRGDYSTGILSLTNAGGLSFKIVSYQGFWMEDSSGNIVPGFILVVNPRIFTAWASHKTYTMSYNISAARTVPSGLYTLHMKFWAFTNDNTMYIVKASVPVKVVAGALQFGVARAYVRERPGSSYALNGETIVVFSHVLNRGHHSVSITASVTFGNVSASYFKDVQNLTMVPGDNLVRFSIPVGYEVPPGVYTLDYTLSYPDGSYTYSKHFGVKFGVSLVALSLESTTVKVNQENHAYLTLLSERDITLNLTVLAYRGSRLSVNESRPVRVHGGTDVIAVSLPTQVPGSITSRILLSYDGREIVSREVSYSVFAPLTIDNLSYVAGSSGKVVFTLQILNPNAAPINGTLVYRVYSGSTVISRDSVRATFIPGVTSMRVTLRLPVGKEISYEFNLLSLGGISTKRGSLYIHPPIPTATSSPTPSTTSAPVSNSTSALPPKRGGTSSLLVAVVILLLICIGVAFYYFSKREGPKKRKRSKPKRHSPLGRFKRPKMPMFKESRELPKKK